MDEYRITKYNPIYRNEYGNYINDEWSSYWDIGKVFNKKKLILSDYLTVENKYIDVILILLRYKGIKTVNISGLEKHNNKFDKNTSKEMKRTYNKLRDNISIDIFEIKNLCKLILREYVWVKLKCTGIFIHFGYDFYMYVGIDNKYESCLQKIEKLGLFIENFKSPYVD